MAGFEKLRIWQEAHQLMMEISKIIKTIPNYERFGVGNQISRSSSSVADNISEGYSSYYYKDKIKGMYTARKEAGETQNHLRSLESKRYISKSTCDILISRYEGLIKGINSWINYVRLKMNSTA